MKTIYSCLFILTFFISCDTTPDSKSERMINRELTNRTTNELPGYNANPYDEAGWVHNELFESYYESSSKPTSVSDIISRVQALADANPNFNSIKTATYRAVSAERINYILEHKNTCVADIIAASSLTSKGKVSLSSFVNSLIVTFDTESNCDVLYKFVTDYEKVVLEDSLLTARDKQLILTTTSIARHSTYLAKKKPKKNTDPDWTILIVHIAAALDGAEYGLAESITEGLVAGIVSN
ncbi:hypothetical protein [Flavobacterium phycosphaerae]|jgi:hypothetical protein|nr:hypothetical protein [Flavobacterium phycosphaerae]